MKCRIKGCKNPEWAPHHHHKSFFNDKEISLFPCVCLNPGGEETTVAPPKFVKEYPRALLKPRENDGGYHLYIIEHDIVCSCCLGEWIMAGPDLSTLYAEAYKRIREIREERKSWIW